VPRSLTGSRKPGHAGSDASSSGREATCSTCARYAAAILEVGWGEAATPARNRETRVRLGIECKYQATTGTAEEKIPTTIQDISAWPIPGIVVFEGKGFSPFMRSFLVASGKAVEFEDLEAWLRLFFGLELR
jgi:hypothetical protein